MAVHYYYSFGSPRVGNEQFVKALEDLEDGMLVTIWRIANSKDAVPRVPTWSPIFPYVHLGTPVLVKTAAQLTKKGKEKERRPFTPFPMDDTRTYVYAVGVDPEYCRVASAGAAGKKPATLSAITQAAMKSAVRKVCTPPPDDSG